MSQDTTSWVVVGTYEEDGVEIRQVMSVGFETSEQAWEAAEQMTENAPDIIFDAETAAYCADAGIE